MPWKISSLHPFSLFSGWHHGCLDKRPEPLPNISLPSLPANGKSHLHKKHVDRSMFDWASPLQLSTTIVLGTRHLCMKGSWVPVHNISIPIIPSGGKVELAYHYLNVRSEDDQTPISCAADPEKLMEHRTQDSIFTKGQYPQAHSTTLYHLTARPCQFLIVYCLLPPSKKCLSRAEPIVTDFNQ